MKSIFSQISKSSLLNRVMRLAIVVVCLSYSAAVVGNTYQSKMTVKVATNSTGNGKVWVTKNDNNAPAENAYLTEDSSSQGVFETQTHTYYLYALANDGYYHSAWSTNAAGTSVVDNSGTGTTQFAVQVSASSTSSSSPTSHTRWAVFKEYLVYKDNTRAIAMLVKADGTPELDDDGNPLKDGGYVNIGSPAVDQVDVTYTGSEEYKKTKDGKWDYVYYAQNKDNHEFIGWFEYETLKNLLTTNGKVDLEHPETRATTYTKKFTTTTPYSQKVDAPSGGVMVAVFRASQSYYHYGPHVTIGGEALERAEKGHVYADDGAAGSIDAVQDDQWKIEIYDKNTYEEDNPRFSYTYYAETMNPEKYAFKGWAYTPFGEPVYKGNVFDAADLFAATDANTVADNPYLTPTLYAIFESYFYKAPSASFANMADGLGSIAVSLETTNAPTWSDGNVNASNDLQQVAANEDSYEYSVHYYAKEKDGAYFLGWSTTADGQNIIPESNTKNENGTYHYVPKNNYVTRAKDKAYPHVAAPLYAVFRSDIDIRQQDRMIVYIDDEGNGNINDAKVLVDFQKADILTATLSGADASFFTLSNRSGSKSGKTINFDATQGLIEMVVSYTDDDLRAAVGKKAEITFSANYEGQTVTRSIVIVVEEAPIITFLPTDGKGTYTVKMTNGSGVNYTVDKTAKENLKVAVTHESMSNIEMHLTEDVKENPDYYFFGWQMIDGDEVTYLSYDKLCTYQFTKSVKVRAQFLHPNHATYFIKNDETNTPYSDLTLALADASKLKNTTGKPQIVIFNTKPNGTKIKEGLLPQGDYIVPEGVTLLIPGDDNNNHATNYEELNYNGSGSEYVKWIVEKGTTITVKGAGAISVYATIHCGGANEANGKPAQYGHVQLGENVKMTFENGSNLYAFGYITGPKTASVLMKNGSKVQEMFQLYDWRGGSATAGNLSSFKRNKVLIFGQYYVQNIEVPLTLEPEATEVLAAGILMRDGQSVYADCTFASSDVGFFHLGDATTLTRYYNADEDRLVFTFAQQEGKTPTKVAKVANASLTLEIMGTSETINTSEFVLPIPHNYDIIVDKNATLQILYDCAFLPGSTLTINKGCTALVKATSGTANVYVYDKKYSTFDGLGYLSSTNKEFKAVTGRPGGMQYTRTSNDIVDAKFVIDGVLDCTSAGALYTTNTTSELVDHANITSNGGGKVLLGSLGTKTDVKQARQSDGILGQTVDFVSIPVAHARLLNANGQYKVPDANTSYTYVKGEWKADGADEAPIIPEVKNYIPTFTVSPSYTISAYVGETQSISTDIVTANANVDWAKVTWAYSIVGQDADQFSLTWGTRPAATLKFTPESEGVKKAVLRITATYKKPYDYDPTNTSKQHTHVYTKDIDLVGNASYLQTNELAFADLNVLYTGQGAIPLFKANSKNNGKPITITTTPTDTEVVTTSGSDNNATIKAKQVGKVTITATQPADLTKYVAATTITKTVEITERVVWNWDILYFGSVNKNPVTVLDGTTDWTLVESKDTSNVVAFDKNTLIATIEDQIAGKYGAEFTFKQGDESKIFKSVIITNPQHLRVDVNNDTVFRAVTLSANESVEFNTTAKAIKFQSTANSISQWKMTFIGVPDKIYFKPQGNNAWQIEESYNGVNWTTSHPWKYIATNSDFEMSLMPSTRYLRISYGAGETTPALLKELYITELAHVKTDVEKLYMPFTANEDGTKAAILTPKEIVLTYANTATLSVRTSDSNIFKVKKSSDSGDPGETLTIQPTTESNPFGITGIEVVSHATSEQQGYLYVYEGSNMVLQIPIVTYAFPQELPIKLATDKPDGGDRYYYVTTRTHNAEWNGTDGVRTITLNNAVSDAAPEVVFAFRGNPTYISFDHTTAKGTWGIEQSTDGEDWEGVHHNDANNDIMNGTNLKRTVKPEANYLRVIYKSPYAEKIDISNLIIVGDASAVVDPARLELDYDQAKQLTVSVVNLSAMTITSKNANFKVDVSATGSFDDEIELTFAENVMADVPIFVKWTGSNAVEYGSLEITNPADGKLLATVELIGMRSQLTTGDINIFTGVPKDYTLDGSFEKEAKLHRKLNINAAFSNAATPTPLFDYVVVYGETTTNDGSTTITTPNTMVGSNAKTPIYIYKKNDAGTAYVFFKRVENANSKEKAWNVGGDDADAVTIPTGKNSLSMYITGFCPYASTGYTKVDEGVWYFRAKGGQSIDIYLEDCFIYSRSKTDDGHAFIDRGDGYSFVEPYVCGSGAVLVFACDNKTNVGNPMNVTIHTLDHNMLKSHYGCFLQSVAGRAYQASSPLQIRVLDNTYIKGSATTLNFTDEWPASQNAITGKRTNGFLSLQKQVNNAPSIDMGNGNTIVNFNGGQVELQNAQIVSPNYKSSLAICPRSGEFAGFLLAYGMGTDDVSGTVNFTDGTTTVLPMYVSPNFAESYLLDKDANGSYITNSKGEFRTSCLRTPTNTFVYGGSHCMMRACKDPSSQGGAPKDKPNGTPLGLYKYPSVPWTETVDGNTVTHKGGWSEASNGLVTPTEGNVPENYGVESVTPNKDESGNYYLNFWFDPNFESAAQPEVDRTKSFWKTCMTRIEAYYGGYGGAVGGPTEIAMAGDVQDEIVKYLLYCKIDENILSVLKDATYQAPVKNPAPTGDNYVPVHPSKVEGTEYFISNKDVFRVNEKIYYITTATADVWNAFTAPFDVENIYIMETYPENELEEMEWKGKKNRSDILMEQAKHNADFAAFFAVTIALGQEKTFETIYREYIDWAKIQDKASGAWDGEGPYTLRGKSALVPFNGSNWQEADFYLNENAGEWLLTADDGYFKTQWIIPDLSDGTLMEQGKTYSMLLPFCTGCVDYEIQTDANGNPVKDAEGKPVFKLDAEGNKIPLPRDYWDYWSGKFLIFESTYAGPVELSTGEVVDGPGHTIYGSDYVEALAASPEYIESGAVLTGNCSFADLQTMNEKLFTYSPDIKHSTFSQIDLPVDGLGNPQPLSIVPTESFLVADIPTPAGVKVRGVTTSGQIIYDNNGDGTMTGGNIPTVGGGNELFITSTATGINIAVAEPQQVRVMSATGAIIYSGMVQTAVDVLLPTAGVYVVAGENEVHKILY